MVGFSRWDLVNPISPSLLLIDLFVSWREEATRLQTHLHLHLQRETN